MGSAAGSAAKAATDTIHIAVSTIGDPVGTGLVTSLAHPGGNVTGVTDVSIELSGKRLDLLRQTVPAVERVAVLWNSADYGMTLREARIEAAAKLFGLALQPLPVREPEDFDSAFANLERDRPDALLITTDAMTTLNQKRVVDFAERMRLPTMYELREPVYRGGLMSYGPSLRI
jgi:putative ABC transport system substrate-binding protein